MMTLQFPQKPLVEINSWLGEMIVFSPTMSTPMLAKFIDSLLEQLIITHKITVIPIEKRIKSPDGMIGHYSLYIENFNKTFEA